MLKNQYHLYSVDTGSFYSNHEKALHDKLRKYRHERIEVKQKLEELRSAATSFEQELFHWTNIDAHKRRKAKETKEYLLSLLSNKTAQNELTDGKDHTRLQREF